MSSYNRNMARGFSPITPPPLPSQPGMIARQTGHLESNELKTVKLNTYSYTHRASPIPPCIAIALRCIVDFRAANRQAPQHMCPQGVSVALVGGEKQIGQVYADRGSLGGFVVIGDFAFVGGESEISMIDVGSGVWALAFPFPFLSSLEYS